jgi:hypothetical protein
MLLPFSFGMVDRPLVTLTCCSLGGENGFTLNSKQGDRINERDILALRNIRIFKCP